MNNFVSDEQRKAVMANLNQNKGVGSESIEIDISIPGGQPGNKMYKPGAKRQCNAFSTENGQQCGLRAIHSAPHVFKNWNIVIPNDSTENIWNSFKPFERQEVVRTGGQDKKIFSHVAVWNDAFFNDWDKATNNEKALFEAGLKKMGKGKVLVNYTVTDKKPAGKKHGYHSSRSGKWYTWDEIDSTTNHEGKNLTVERLRHYGSEIEFKDRHGVKWDADEIWSKLEGTYFNNDAERNRWLKTEFGKAIPIDPYESL